MLPMPQSVLQPLRYTQTIKAILGPHMECETRVLPHADAAMCLQEKLAASEMELTVLKRTAEV